MFAPVHESIVLGSQALIVLDIDFFARDKLAQSLQELEVVVDDPKVEGSVASYQSLFMDVKHFILEERVEFFQGSLAFLCSSYLKQVGEKMILFGRTLLVLLFFVDLLWLLIARVSLVLQDSTFSI